MAEKPTWMKMKSSEVEGIIVDLAKKGESPAKIGLILRDQHGIPKAKLTGKRISEVLVENKMALPSEKKKIDEELVILRSHMAKNKKDNSAKRALTKRLWALHKLDSKR